MGRDLFIGLGGTGGKTLHLLFKRMTEEQRKNASYVYMDTNRHDINDLMKEGIKTIRISNANTVRELAEGLGQGDGVRDWLPFGEREGVFLNSGVDDGASQYRYKSRLCLARFLRDPNNELHNMLVSLTPPGAEIKNERMRVIIVSSIAGGTGAGSFIELALYVRKFFRDYSQSSVTITGILACPDLYTKLPSDETGDNERQRISMYANAYAAIRELNAMNLATSPGATSNNYGKKIRIAINTKSEGKLFDSQAPEFRNDTKAKPFDLIYFIDEANNRGGILSSIEQYYALMADIAYSRLYSPLELSIGDGESNELDHHNSAPTAIYGSAGYARVRYPYTEILNYLAERKILDEIDSRWRLFDDQWKAECEAEQDIALQEGRFWKPSELLRGRRYMEQLRADLDSERSAFRFLQDMIRTKQGRSKVDEYLTAINQAIRVGDIESVADDAYGSYSLRRDTEVQEAIALLVSACSGGGTSAGADPIDRLETMYQSVTRYWSTLCAALRNAVSGQAHRLAGAIIPQTATALQFAASNKLPINLHWGLLVKDKKDVHPLAARYLLYQLREKLNEALNGTGGTSRSNFQDELIMQAQGLTFAFDDDWSDDDDYTVDDEVKSLRKIWRSKKQDADAKKSLNKYRSTVLSCVSGALDIATAEYKRMAFRMLLEPVNELITQYETFFENLEHYQQELQRTVRKDLVLHDSSRNQTIFVGASSKVKNYYYLSQPNVSAAIENSNAQCYSAAGSGVYEAMEKRMLNALEVQRSNRRMGVQTEKNNRFDDMSNIFTAIIKKLRDHLKANAAYLNTDVVGALVHEICAEIGLEEGGINATAAYQTNFRDAFYRRMADLEEKALPMIRYNKMNRQKYFVKEEMQGNWTDESLLYRHYGISPQTANRLASYFPTTGADPLQEFKTFLGTTSIVCDAQFNDYEIFCFCAVHCLQPNQIYHFDEFSEGSYYEAYKARVHTAIENGTLSKSPHIDKRWHLKGAMPYISKDMELKWRDRIMRAFIYQILTRQITFTIDREGRECFYHCLNGSPKYIEWPARVPVLTRNISSLLAYLAEDEILVDRSAKDLDELIRASIARNSSYSGTVRLYKASMAKDPVLKRMRMKAVSFYKTSENGAEMTDDDRRIAEEVHYSRRSLLDEEDVEYEDDEIVNLKSTLGGILRIAYLLHISEERLDEDKDFGEALLETVTTIIDEYAIGMYGPAHVNSDSKYHREYVDIFNWIMDRFMNSWIEQVSCEQRLTGEKLERVAEEDDLYSIVTGNTANERVRKIPVEVQQTEEYIWVSNNWKHKKY